MKKSKAKADPRGRDLRLDKVLVAKLIVSAVLVSLCLSVYQNLKKADYFRVNEITVRQAANATQDEKNFSYLKGRNIFELDLDKEARSAAYYYPSYQKIRITRFFPSHLVVDFLKRDPRACVRGPRNFCIDDNLVLFEPADPQASAELPLVTGVERDLLAVKFGGKCESPAVAGAMNIIKSIREDRAFKGYSVKKVDMSGLSNASIFLLVSGRRQDYTKTDFLVPEQLMEVKIGREDIRNKLALLATLLAQVKNNIYNIEYIDLRFKEPVIKFREREKNNG